MVRHVLDEKNRILSAEAMNNIDMLLLPNRINGNRTHEKKLWLSVYLNDENLDKFKMQKQNFYIEHSGEIVDWQYSMYSLLNNRHDPNLIVKYYVRLKHWHYDLQLEMQRKKDVWQNVNLLPLHFFFCCAKIKTRTYLL